MNMDAQLYVYHRNFCIQYCVCGFVLLKYPGNPGKKKLNIRIYSERKNNYFYSNVHIKQKSSAFEELVIYKSVLDD
jgi:hypothetical protein